LQGKRDGSTRDEAFAWESREFLRKKLIGQVRAEAAAAGSTAVWMHLACLYCKMFSEAVCSTLTFDHQTFCPLLQPCVFRVDYTVEVAGNKEFGSLFLQNGQQQENVALSIVQNGWAKVSSCSICCSTAVGNNIMVSADRQGVLHYAW
jgi:staphylococcal nuclease domain-containing protein 1